MNIQFEKLAEQAGFNIHNDTIDGHNFNHEIEKFAQLIVQECIDIIAPYTVRMSRPGEEYLHPILEIKQHFGVEQ
jgi:hypothetical protein